MNIVNKILWILTFISLPITAIAFGYLIVIAMTNSGFDIGSVAIIIFLTVSTWEIGKMFFKWLYKLAGVEVKKGSKDC